jgi:TPR repeat protein
MSSSEEEEPCQRPLREQVHLCMQKWAREYKQMALQGEVEGMEAFGIMAYKGYGTNQSYNVAIRWLEEAVKKGSPWAKEKLEEVKREKAAKERESKPS